MTYWEAWLWYEEDLQYACDLAYQIWYEEDGISWRELRKIAAMYMVSLEDMLYELGWLE